MLKFLVLGAGELGTAIIEALFDHKAFDPEQHSIALLVRPSSITDTKASPKRALLDRFQARGVQLVAADLDVIAEDELTSMFKQYASVIHAGAMTQTPGTQLKITRAALAALVQEYVPWQWGVDYDIIGPYAGEGLFREQCEVRALLRAQTKTQWFIISCGIFMSFLFEPFWGVIGRNDEGEIDVIRALGDWGRLLTVTTAHDIARCNAQLLLVDHHRRGNAKYIAGETLTYNDFAAAVEEVTEKRFRKEIWTSEYLENESKKAPDNKLLKYRLVFSQPKGLSWLSKTLITLTEASHWRATKLGCVATSSDL